MKKAALLCLAVVFLAPALAAADTYQTVTYEDPWRWGTRTMTAALVNPSEPVTGEVDATGCDVGVYFSGPGTKGLVKNAKIHGAGRYGVFVNGDAGDLTVDVLSSSIYDIGILTAPEGWDYWGSGVAVGYQDTSGRTGGRVAGNFISRYRCAGIVVWGTGTDVQIADNIITGLGAGAQYSQNGSQFGMYVDYWAKVTIERNTVANNVYTGPDPWWTSAGIMGVFTPGTRITQNVLVNNQIGIWNPWVPPDTLPGSGYVPPTTRVTVANNRIVCDALYPQPGFQVGIWFGGSQDRFVSNEVTGPGYDLTTLPGYTYPMLLDFETDPRVKPIR